MTTKTIKRKEYENSNYSSDIRLISIINKKLKQ